MGKFELLSRCRTGAAAVVLAVGVLSAPWAAHAAASGQCTVNGKAVPAGRNVMGTPGKDDIECTGPIDFRVNGGRGDDKIVIHGDVVAGGVVDGGFGNDTITVTGSVTSGGKVTGGPGDDRIDVGQVLTPPADPGTVPESGDVDGGRGNDIITVDRGPLTGAIHGDDGDDTIKVAGDVTGFGYINGDFGNDTITVTGSVKADQRPTAIEGGPGNDVITTGDVYGSGIDGGAGDDTITTGTVSHSARVDGGEGNDRITVGVVYGLADVSGNGGDDVIEAKALAPSRGFARITGGGGKDQIRGIGNTVLVVGPSPGVLDGGSDPHDTCKAKAVGQGVIKGCKLTS